jgi:hypothetical protein
MYFDGTMETNSDQNMKISLVGNGQIQGFFSVKSTYEWLTQT